MGKPYFHTNVFLIGLMKNPDLKTFVIQGFFVCYIQIWHSIGVWHPPKSWKPSTGQPSSRWRDLAGAAACVGLKAKSQRKYPGGNQRKGQWSRSRSISIQNSENKIHNIIIDMAEIAFWSSVVCDSCWTHSEQMAEWLWCFRWNPPRTPTEMPLLDLVEFRCHGWQGLRNGSSQGATPNRSHGAT